MINIVNCSMINGLWSPRIMYYSATSYVRVYGVRTLMLAVCLMDVALVIDHSGSIRDNNKPGGPDNWGQVIEFVKAVVRKLKVSVTSPDILAVVSHLQVIRNPEDLCEIIVNVLGC